MTVDDAIMKFQILAKGISGDFMRQVADEITVEVVDRIQKRTIFSGTSYQGNKYLTKSKNPYNSFYSKSHAAYRKAHGRGVGMRNYYLTGNLFGNIGRIKMIQQDKFIDIWIGARGMNRRNDGSSISNKELMNIHSFDDSRYAQGVNLLGITNEDLKNIGKKLELRLVTFLR
jgi:hypothetical protein